MDYGNKQITFSFLAPTKVLSTEASSKPLQTMPPESVNGPTRNVFDKMMVQYPAMSGKRSDLVLHYTFEKLDEDMVLDSSGFNNNARLIEGKGEYH